MTTILYKTENGAVLDDGGEFYELPENDWDVLLNRNDHELVMTSMTRRSMRLRGFDPQTEALAPIGRQEVWAAGVTYYRSRTARMEESKDAGGGSFYDRVYAADRPELFFKATPNRVVGTGKKVRIRRDSKWNVPEPELVLVVNSLGQIIGYTIGNDMSSRDIEGENPLYLPQAKVYDGSCAIGPSILLKNYSGPFTRTIGMSISREGDNVFEGKVSTDRIRRTEEELTEYLFREMTFEHGAFLLTGTGIVPPDDFSLMSGDIVRITIEGIGTLENPVA